MSKCSICGSAKSYQPNGLTINPADQDKTKQAGTAVCTNKNCGQVSHETKEKK